MTGPKAWSRRRLRPDRPTGPALAPPGKLSVPADHARSRANEPAHFKAPRGVTFTGELPKTATGKIQKFVLRKGAPNLSRQWP